MWRGICLVRLVADTLTLTLHKDDIHASRARIMVEVFAIDMTTFTYLDRLERYPDGYDRIHRECPPNAAA
ncbi:hypothetical protein SAMN05421509_108104 [Chromohalobacter canadensis]|uniref:Uncharacterized protein n=1 Tax=Chromohalobacter canadensis TaxID=141389 RepID=A0A285VT28_9GAMM|nr:hypothetical protein SAMN05421509_108104 [Chromohalobacter canadensis]